MRTPPPNTGDLQLPGLALFYGVVSKNKLGLVRPAQILRQHAGDGVQGGGGRYLPRGIFCSRFLHSVTVWSNPTILVKHEPGGKRGMEEPII